MEIKDENTDREPVIKVMKQALSYATFINELLRDEDVGSEYLNKIFGIGSKLNKQIEIYVVTIMPFKARGDSEKIEKDIPVGNTIYKLRTMYYKLNKQGDGFDNIEFNRECTNVNDSRNTK